MHLPFFFHFFSAFGCLRGKKNEALLFGGVKIKLGRRGPNLFAHLLNGGGERIMRWQ
jgi:hypothetical protein